LQARLLAYVVRDDDLIGVACLDQRPHPRQSRGVAGEVERLAVAAKYDVS
jgi:hypothetical protein